MKTRQLTENLSGWVAFVNGTECVGIREFPNGGKAFTFLEIVSKPTEAELKAELKRLKISLPQ